MIRGVIGEIGMSRMKSMSRRNVGPSLLASPSFSSRSLHTITPPIRLPPQIRLSSTTINHPVTSPSLSPIPSLPPLLPPQIDPLPTTTPSALSLLKSSSTPQSGLYILARLHSRTYLLHPRDILTLPTLKPVQEPGTKLSLTRILEVGSREHSIRSPAAEGKLLRKNMTIGKEEEWEYIPDWIVKCQVTVLEHTKSPMERLIKKKRRKGYKKTIEHKQGWTRLRVGDIVLGDGVSPES